MIRTKSQDNVDQRILKGLRYFPWTCSMNFPDHLGDTKFLILPVSSKLSSEQKTELLQYLHTPNILQNSLNFYKFPWNSRKIAVLLWSIMNFFKLLHNSLHFNKFVRIPMHFTALLQSSLQILLISCEGSWSPSKLPVVVQKYLYSISILLNFNEVSCRIKKNFNGVS